jgi:hypothetical protein
MEAVERLGQRDSAADIGRLRRPPANTVNGTLRCFSF